MVAAKDCLARCRLLDPLLSEVFIIRGVVIGMAIVVGSLVEARKTPLLRSILTQKLDGEVHLSYDVSSFSRVCTEAIGNEEQNWCKWAKRHARAGGY